MSDNLTSNTLPSVGAKVKVVGGCWDGMVGWLKAYTPGGFAALHSNEWKSFPERAVNLEYCSLIEVADG